jgi:hypothetical protein
MAAAATISVSCIRIAASAINEMVLAASLDPMGCSR